MQYWFTEGVLLSPEIGGSRLLSTDSDLLEDVGGTSGDDDEGDDAGSQSLLALPAFPLTRLVIPFSSLEVQILNWEYDSNDDDDEDVSSSSFF